MRKILFLTAALGLMAAPALAQDRHDGDDHRGGGAPHTDMHQGHDAHPGGAPRAPQAAPVAAPAAPAAQPNNTMMMRRDDHRFDNNRGNNNNGRAGFDNNRGNNFRPGNNGQHHNFQNFSNYHRNFNAGQRFHAPTYRRPPGYYAHRWTWGDRLPAAFWVRDYWLSNFAIYDLPPPPFGAVWVRYGNDALLIDQDSGEVIEVEYGVFY